jgi:hypothetical protein
MLVDPANARLGAHLGRRLADFAAAKKTHPVALLARGEADFQTQRTLKLAPDNDAANSGQGKSNLQMEPRLFRVCHKRIFLFSGLIARICLRTEGAHAEFSVAWHATRRF